MDNFQLNCIQRVLIIFLNATFTTQAFVLVTSFFLTSLPSFTQVEDTGLSDGATILMTKAGEWKGRGGVNRSRSHMDVV